MTETKKLPVAKLKQDRELSEKREQMIERQLKGRGISDLKVLTAFKKVAREIFLPPALQDEAYEDHPLPIGHEQTISQPYIVALMTESLALTSSDRVLEIGTGSGYQTAILAELANEVYSIEINEALHKSAQACLKNQGYQNVFLKCDDGRKGWLEAAPFDKIIVTAAAEEIPKSLVEQLKEGGKMIIPVTVGLEEQDLILARKEKGILITRQLIPVRFVPLRADTL